jgi:hypothetical protein
MWTNRIFLVPVEDGNAEESLDLASEKPRSRGKSRHFTYSDKRSWQEERTQNRNYFHHCVISLRLSDDDLLLFEHAGLIFNDFELII